MFKKCITIYSAVRVLFIIVRKEMFMVNVSKLKLMLCSMIIMASTCYSQSAWIGASGGALRFKNPDLFTKSISGKGLDFDWGVQLGIRAKYAFKNIPVKLTGLFNYNNFKGKGSTNLIAPPWS
jgi:hypothetical protein